MKKLAAVFPLGILLLPLFAASAAVPPTQDRWYGDIRRFDDNDFDRWSGGRWLQGAHGGRSGWWWIVGDGWYFYPAPVYPYPDPYVPSAVVSAPSPAAGATPYAWYYCPGPSGYYPYVPECAAPWQKIPTGIAGAQPIASPVSQAAKFSPVSLPLGGFQPNPERDQDDRQLNAFAFEFLRIDLHSGDAVAQLKDLEGRVEGYRRALLTRNYNVSDIVKDTEVLQHRMQTEEIRFIPKKEIEPPLAQPSPEPPQPAPEEKALVVPLAPPASDAPLAPPASLPAAPSTGGFLVLPPAGQAPPDVDAPPPMAAPISPVAPQPLSDPGADSMAL